MTYIYIYLTYIYILLITISYVHAPNTVKQYSELRIAIPKSKRAPFIYILNFACLYIHVYLHVWMCDQLFKTCDAASLPRRIASSCIISNIPFESAECGSVLRDVSFSYSCRSARNCWPVANMLEFWFCSYAQKKKSKRRALLVTDCTHMQRDTVRAGWRIVVQGLAGILLC